MRSLCLLAALAAVACDGDKTMKNLRIRPSAIAGSWYTDDKAALIREIDGYLSRVDTVLSNVVIRGLIVPHAGYVYSGRAAAYSFRQLEGRKVDRVFILGPSHYTSFHGASIPSCDAYETPLGQVMLDTGVVARLNKDPLFSDVPRAHDREHCIEIELPFLQRVLDEFTIVPIIISDVDPGEARELGALIKSCMGSNDVIVASTDFTHYGANFGFAPFKSNTAENLTKLDMGALDLALARNIAGIYEYARRTGITWDGITVTPVMIAALPEGVKGEKLLYYKSGDLNGDYSHSVSYVAAAFHEPAATPGRVDNGGGRAAAAGAPAGAETKRADGAAAGGMADEHPLTQQEKAMLLKIARETLVAHVEGKPLPDVGSLALTERLKERAGAFVTLHSHGELRGCIGYIEGIKPLAETVQENACNAATEDPRFPRVKPAELKNIDIEISVMSPLRKAGSPGEVVAGKHGVVLKKGWHQGVFLPQVATEQGWDRVTFLKHLGLKAGLDMDAYKSGELWLFTAEVFGEEKK
ncbi:AmmeMemoRadiSam system protein B [bacterium]|nr:AmmeMemoRadiSam system protein B [bacterium]